MKYLISYPEEKGSKILKDLKHTSEASSRVTSRFRDNRILKFFVKRAKDSLPQGLLNLQVQTREISKTSSEVTILQGGIAGIIGEKQIYGMLKSQAKDYGDDVSVERIEEGEKNV